MKGARGGETNVFESDLLDPYEKLVRIEVLGRAVEVPERNRLLRCFQFLSIETISYGDFCWNGDCANCQIWFHDPGQPTSRTSPPSPAASTCATASSSHASARTYESRESTRTEKARGKRQK